jgi:hypothetical protein
MLLIKRRDKFTLILLLMTTLKNNVKHILMAGVFY